MECAVLPMGKLLHLLDRLLNVKKCKNRRKRGSGMTGGDLQQLLLGKWGKSFDVRLRRTRGKIFVLVMWKYLEQASFPMTEVEYLEHLNAIAHYLDGWGSSQQVIEFLEKTRDRPRVGHAVGIPLDLGERASEWLLEEF
ncbi:MAG: hypothetical protein RLZZ338_3164 [Cyanobacteriota bacterium]